MAITFQSVFPILMFQTASPLKAEKFWAEMRSTAYLFSKSPWPTDEQAGQLISELQDILGKRIITYPPTFRKFGIDANTPYKMKKTFLGLDAVYNNSETDEKDMRFLRFMAGKAEQARKANWTWRITQEAEQKQKDKWYPFFVTLTVDPKMCDGKRRTAGNRVLPAYNCPAELWQEGREFRTYIRNLAKIVCQLLGHPPPHKKTKEFDYRPESDYVTYAAVIEHGATMEHHHCHMMVWLREIPSKWKMDPNEGRLPQYRFERENKAMRYLWPWAIPSQKPALYYRTKGDIWSENGHVTPIDRETGQPVKINEVGAVGAYVTKYMQKGDKVWHHRMKCTRNLGMQKIQKLIDQFDRKTLQALSWKPSTSDQLLSVNLTHSAPLGIVRSQAKRRLFAITWESKLSDLKILMKTNYEHYKKMLMSVRDGARPDRMPSAEFYDWVAKHLPAEVDYCEVRLKKAHNLLREHFKVRTYRVQPIVLGGNQVGFTQCI